MLKVRAPPSHPTFPERKRQNTIAALAVTCCKSRSVSHFANGSQDENYRIREAPCSALFLQNVAAVIAITDDNW